MFKTFVTLALTFFFLFASSTDAATKKAKRKISKTTDGKFRSHYSKSGTRAKAKMAAKYKRKRGGSSVDLKALTTESPYTDNPDNGVNSVETKPGIQ